MPFTCKRPAPDKRLFTAPSIEACIEKTTAKIADPEIAWLFRNCFPNTLDTTVSFSEDKNGPDSFVITGDIDAMWLRDSTAQIWPYLRFSKSDTKIDALFRGLIRRQMRCIHLDPHANAFYREATTGYWAKDLTEMKPGVHERKWELDSLCYFLRLSTGYWQETANAAIFDEAWKETLLLVLDTANQQRGENNYRFQRHTERGTETLSLAGLGNPTKPCGLIRSSFRPSDDATILPFLIPSNAFFAVELEKTAELIDATFKDSNLSTRCRTFAAEIREAIGQHAIVSSPDCDFFYAYEVDGYGGRIIMDDANIPSLLSLPYLGFCDVSDPLYQSTRKVILSSDNPYFFHGTAGEGVGGPHIGLGYIWPMAVIMRAFTSNDDEEIANCLATIKSTHAGTGFMHETFQQDDPSDFTRSWFGWVNSLFGELILKILDERPHLLTK